MIRPLRTVTLVLLSLVAATTQADTPTPEPHAILEPPAAESALAPIPLPTVDGLEAAVQDQLTSAADDAARVLANDDRAAWADTYRHLGRLYHAYGLTEPAEIAYRNALVLEPRDGDTTRLYGRLLGGEDRADEALITYQRAAALEPSSPLPPYLAGRLLFTLGRSDEAARALLAARRRAPDEAAINLALGEALLALDQPQQALELLEAAAERAPSANRIHFLLARAAKALGDDERADHELALSGDIGVDLPDPAMEALDLLVEGERAHLRRGHDAYRSRRFTMAAVEFARAVAADPASCTARTGLAASLSAAGESAAALAETAENVRRCPDNVIARSNLGSMLLAAGKPAEAIRHLGVAVQLDPQDLASRRELARALVADGRVEDGRAELQRALSLAPQEPALIIDLAALDIRQGDETGALARLDAASTANPSDGLIADQLARLLSTASDLDLRDANRAVDLATKVFEAAPSAAHLETLALAMSEAGQCEETVALLNEKAGDLVRDLQSPQAERLRALREKAKAGPPCRPRVE